MDVIIHPYKYLWWVKNRRSLIRENKKFPWKLTMHWESHGNGHFNKSVPTVHESRCYSSSFISPRTRCLEVNFLLFPYEISEIYICQDFSPKIMNVNHMVALQGRSRNTRICGIRPLGNKHINFMATHPKVVRPEGQDDTTGWIVPGEKHGCTSNPDMQSAADPELIRYSCSLCSILKSVPK